MSRLEGGWVGTKLSTVAALLAVALPIGFSKNDSDFNLEAGGTYWPLAAAIFLPWNPFPLGGGGSRWPLTNALTLRVWHGSLCPFDTVVIRCSWFWRCVAGVRRCVGGVRRCHCFFSLFPWPRYSGGGGGKARLGSAESTAHGAAKPHLHFFPAPCSSSPSGPCFGSDDWPTALDGGGCEVAWGTLSDTGFVGKWVDSQHVQSAGGLCA